MLLKHAGDAANSASSATSGSTPNPRETGKDNILINPEVFDVFKPRKPQRRPTAPPAPKPAAPVPPTTPKGTRPQLLINPDVAAAFASAGMLLLHGTLTERAALYLSRLLRDMLEDKRSSPDEVPFYEPIAAAYGASQSNAMNAACQAHAQAIRAALESTLATRTDAAKARVIAAKAQPFVAWDTVDNGWAVNLYSGDFINALWDVVGGRTANNAPTFDKLMGQLQEAAREPIATELEASEERFYDLVDRVMGIIMETQHLIASREERLSYNAPAERGA